MTRIGSWPALKPLSALTCLVVLTACESEHVEPTPPPEPVEVTAPDGPLQFELISWDAVDLSSLDFEAALSAFHRSCAVLERRSGSSAMSEATPFAGRVEDWQNVCRTEATTPQSYFSTHFQPVRITTETSSTGMLTGYYEPLLEVRTSPSGNFTQPIRSRPDDLLSADLGAFNSDLAGQRIMGRVEGNRFVPFSAREHIEEENQGEVLAWGEPIDVFFLQIQGSGRLVFEDGRVQRAAFSAHNGQPYASIGRELVSRGEMQAHEASKGRIEAWLNENGPEATAELFAVNPRYVFFALQDLPDLDLGPSGAAGLPLTPMASIAVDPTVLPYGLPVILTADIPDEPSWQGLVITQDTGGAITGPLRADLFYGWGEDAERRAGTTRAQAEWILLLPHGIAERLVQPA